jgi:hypothetical protein
LLSVKCQLSSQYNSASEIQFLGAIQDFRGAYTKRRL